MIRATFLASLFSLFFITAGFAQTQHEFDDLRANRTSFKSYLQELIRRRLAIDVSQAMTNNGFKSDAIDTVLKGPDFAVFATKVLKSSDVEVALNQMIERIMAPGALEEAIAKQRQETETLNRNRLLMAVEELLMNRKRLATDTIMKDPPSFWERIWAQLRRDLLS